MSGLSGRLDRLGRGAAVAAAVAVMVAWHVVLIGAAMALPSIGPPEWPTLGATVVNLVALSATVLFVVLVGWGREPWFRSFGPRRPLLLVPAVLLSLTYLIPGVSGPWALLVTTAVLQLAVGASEELYARGVMQRLLWAWPLAWRVLLVGMLFGVGHGISGVAFGRSFDDAGLTVVAATVSGVLWAALREHVVSVWPLAVLHALDNWVLTNAAVEAPVWWQVAVAVATIAYAAALMIGRPLPEVSEGRSTPTAPSRA